MPRKSTKVRKFESETEEADWYTTPEGRGRTQREFARALRTGTLTRSPAAPAAARTDARILRRLMEQAKENATRAISLRIPIADLERAKQIGEKTGVGYQTVLKQAIRRGLGRAG